MRKAVKNPVLTSPWKIGVLVALLLLITNVGVGYYVISQYNVDLEWLKAGNFWEIDSYLFFREMFPLATGILLCSLFSYFVIASAVRRYRFYIDSGQDYRNMVSLADSIDDLTNPAQIARLGDFPELQEILRNYGDQIKDISDEINSREAELAPSELEAEIESLLKGEPVLQAEDSGGKWWAELVRKLERHSREKDEVIENLYSSNDRERRKTASITLSMGRILENAGEARNKIAEITALLSDLDSGTVSSAGPVSAQDPDAKTALSNIGSLLKKLEQGGAAMRQFSERTNGLALNIALLAARGEVDERDLVNYAEKARETAEKFSKLGNAVSGITAELSANHQVMSGGLSGRGGLKDAEAGSAATSAIMKLRPRIEARLSDMENNLLNLEGDLKSMNETLRNMGDEEEIGMAAEYVSAGAQPEKAEAALAGSKAGAENAENKDAGQLIINHGKAWEEKYTAEKRKAEAQDRAGAPLEEVRDEAGLKNDVAGSSGFDEIGIDGAGGEQIEVDSDDMNLQPEAPLEEAPSAEAESADSWDSLNVSEPDKAAEPSDVKVEFREDGITPAAEGSPETEETPAGSEENAYAGEATVAGDETDHAVDENVNQEVPGEPGLEIAYRKHLDQSVRQQDQRSAVEPEAAVSASVSAGDDEDDPIIDLFDLGAVELDKAESPQ